MMLSPAIKLNGRDLTIVFIGLFQVFGLKMKYKEKTQKFLSFSILKSSKLFDWLNEVMNKPDAKK